MAKQDQSQLQRKLDQALVALAMEGDAEGFERLYRRWHSRLLRHAARLLGDSEEARDVTQIAAITIAQNIHRLKSPDKFGPWSYAIVRNRAVELIRKNQRHRSLKAAVQAEEPAATVQHTASTSEFEIKDLIRSLAPIDSEVLTAFYVDQMSVREVAACLALPEGTVKSRLFKARQRLKSAYETIEGEKS